jgi:hypothetical protein
MPNPHDKLIPVLDSGNHRGLEYTVRDIVEQVLARFGSTALTLPDRPPATDVHRDLVARAYNLDHPLTHREPVRDELAPVLREGLTFLYDTNHPAHPQACTHLGKGYRLGGHRTYTFTPAALGSHHGPVLVVEARGWDCDGLADGEIERVVALLGELGEQVATSWNGGLRAETGSIGLARPASESLMRNVYGERSR